MNNTQTRLFADGFAKQLAPYLTGGSNDQPPDYLAAIERAYQTAYARIPVGRESEIADSFIRKQIGLCEEMDKRQAVRRALADLCHMILSGNEFIYIQLDLDDGPKWNEGPLTDTRDFFNGVNYDRAEFTAAFAQWMVKRKLTPAELRWLTGIMESTPTGIAVQLAADGLFSDYRPELKKLSQEIPTLHVLGEEDAATAKPWLKENAPKAKIEVLGKHMMFWEDPEAFNKIFADFLGHSKQ